MKSVKSIYSSKTTLHFAIDPINNTIKYILLCCAVCVFVNVLLRKEKEE